MYEALALLDAVGARLDDLPDSAEESVFKFKSVPEGPELLRILALPRRPQPHDSSPATVELADFLTGRLAAVPEPYPGRLRPLQAACLQEAWQVRGLAGFLRVGGGKMLTAFLFSVLPGLCPDGRWLYVAPAQMREDTEAQFRKYAKSWVSPEHVFPFRSYEELAHPSNGVDLAEDGSVLRLSLLERIGPSLLVLDESDRCANASNVVTKCVNAYKKKFPRTVVIVLTGTPFKTSIRDAAKVLEWALGDQSPLPRPSVGWEELNAWADYLDCKKATYRANVGALLHLLTADELQQFAMFEGEEEDQRDLVRRAVARRMYDTCGVISSQDGRLRDDAGREIGLSMSPLLPAREDAALDEAFADLRATWQLPDGTELEDGLAFARHASTLGLGFVMRNDPPPPDEYRDARREWASWCRNVVRRNRRGINSAAQLVRALRKGLYNDEGRLARWQEAQAAYRTETGLREPPSVAQWFSDEAIDTAAEWARREGGVIFVLNIPFGERLAAKLGVPYYREKAKDALGRHVKDHKDGAAVCSIASCGRGKQLTMWYKALWMTVPGEQALGRLHRAWQASDTVYNWLYLGCQEHLKAFVNAKDAKARFQECMTLQEQKLKYADSSLPTLEELAERGGARWTADEA